MSVLCPIPSIIVRKIPNSRPDCLTRPQAPTPLRGGHRPRGRPGNTSSIVGIPLAATGGDGGGTWHTRGGKSLVNRVLLRNRPHSVPRQRVAAGQSRPNTIFLKNTAGGRGLHNPRCNAEEGGRWPWKTDVPQSSDQWRKQIEGQVVRRFSTAEAKSKSWSAQPGSHSPGVLPDG